MIALSPQDERLSADCQSVTSTTTVAGVIKQNGTVPADASPQRRVSFSDSVQVARFSSQNKALQDQLFYSRSEQASFREEANELTYSAEYMPMDVPERQFYEAVAQLFHEEDSEQTCYMYANAQSFGHLWGLERHAVRSINQEMELSLEEMHDGIREIQEDVLLEDDEKTEMIAVFCQRLTTKSVDFAHQLARASARSFC